MPSYNAFLHYDELQPWLIENVHKMFNKFTLLLMGTDIVTLRWKFDAINVLIWMYTPVNVSQMDATFFFF